MIQRGASYQTTEERISTVGGNWLQQHTYQVTPIVAAEGEVDSVTGNESRWDVPSLEGNDQMFQSYDSENNC